MRASKTFIASSALAFAAAQNNSNSDPTLTALIGDTPSLSGLGTILQAYPNIARSLGNAENVTVFAPNNAAISELQSSGLLDDATEDDVAAILNYHVLQGMVYSSAISETPVFAPTLLDDEMYANVTGGQVVEVALDGQDVVLTSGLKLESTVVQADVNYTNGVVHIIDSVLQVPRNVSTTAIGAGLTALAGALTLTDLVDTVDGLSDVTIFAPTNAAFRAIGRTAANLSTSDLTDILTYHVINGTVVYSADITEGSVTTLQGDDVEITVEDDAVFVNGARVILADVLVAGGVVHVIDSVLNPANATAEADPSATTGVVQFSGASSASATPYTSGIPTASTTNPGLTQTTNEVAATGGSGGNGGSGSGSSSSSSGIAALPTGAVGAAALFGGAAFLANW
ncbi:uncharacterized protein LTR77_007534 [Saxophila tyrrhenica]|uniref:FAS1 domain-containing protein n=1 Tax=Saxophila tyrrhenica TaxID=1690608 RepID=A0AAV9P5M9_9PEZI|nr:hypothetical protein LTR77_007534 [Saxophila tyrrhenica]